MALARSRLAATTLSRIGIAAGLALGSVFAIFVIALRAADGAAAPLEGIIELGAAAIAVVASAPATLAAAADRRAEDREAGIEALAASRGIPARSLDVVRAAAAMLQIGRSIAVPLVGLALLTAALAGSIGMAMQRLVLALGLLSFSAIAGITLGSIATLSSRLGGRRGRLVLAAIVIVPWMIGELVGRGAYSIPGALSAVLSFIVHVGRGGAGA